MLAEAGGSALEVGTRLVVAAQYVRMGPARRVGYPDGRVEEVRRGVSYVTYILLYRVAFCASKVWCVDDWTHGVVTGWLIDRLGWSLCILDGLAASDRYCC